MNPTENQATNPSPKFLVVLVVVMVILGSAWYFFMQPKASQPTAEVEEETPSSNEGIIVTKVDISQAGESKLPVGFPKDIPVEQANVSESYRVAYSDKGVTQYTVSYTSLKGKDVLWDAYNEYLKGAGYEVDGSVTSKSQGQISGKDKEGSSFSAIISARNGVSFVQISLLNRE